MYKRNTSWERDAKHYGKKVGASGHYYHTHVVIPGVLRLLDVKKGDSVLDLGCGQGVLARALPVGTFYMGVDSSKTLIVQARELDGAANHNYEIYDAAKWKGQLASFDAVVMMLSLQNMRDQSRVIENASRHLKQGGKMVIVLNHPCFRIPRQSGWGEHENNLQYRYVNRYLSNLEIPILMHPGEQKSLKTWSYHQPLEFYAQSFNSCGLMIQIIEEWSSDKQSVGKAAKKENRAREEIPLFMAILGRKIDFK